MNSDSGIQPGGGGIEGRAQNIAPLQLIRCLIVESGGMEPCVPTCEWLATTDPPRLTAPAVAFSKLRFGCAFACSCPQYAISDGGAASHRDCRGCPTGSMVPTGDADAKRAISPTFVTHPGIARRGNEGLVLCPPRWRCSSLAYRLSGGMKANSVGSLKLDNKVKGMMDISLQKERLTSEGKAQAEVADTARRAVAETIRHAAVTRAVVPATATAHAVRPTIRTCGIVLRRTAVSTFPIATPFPYVATHIVDAQLVGRLGGNGVGLVATVIIIPSHVAEGVAATILIAAAIVATTCGELPFRLGGQAEVFTGKGIEFANKSLAIFVGNVIHRIV